MNVLTHLRTLRPDLSLLLLRAVTGLVFAFHGSQKLFGAFGGPGIEGFAGWLGSMSFPFPTLNAYLAGGTEFFGGLALILGLGTRFVSLPLAFTMVVAILSVHSGAFSAQANGLEYPLTLGVVSLSLVFSGGGRLSLERLLPPFASQETAAPALAA